VLPGFAEASPPKMKAPALFRRSRLEPAEARLKGCPVRCKTVARLSLLSQPFVAGNCNTFEELPLTASLGYTLYVPRIHKNFPGNVKYDVDFHLILLRSSLGCVHASGMIFQVHDHDVTYITFCDDGFCRQPRASPSLAFKTKPGQSLGKAGEQNRLLVFRKE